MATNVLINLETNGEYDLLAILINGKWAGQLTVPRGTGRRLAHALRSGSITVAEAMPLPFAG